MRQFAYSSASTVAELLDRLGENGAAANGQGELARGGTLSPDKYDPAVRPLAGGTDLLTLMKGEIVTPAQVVDIKRLADLPRGISEEGSWTTLGALTTLSEVEQSEVIQARYPLLAQAAALAATPQLRNMATVGGNLLQRPRCWYFRDAHFHCWLKGGDECHAADGQNQQHALFGRSPCVAAHPSDLAPALMALGAEVQLEGRQGRRTLALEEFFAEPEAARRVETVIEPDEVVLRVRIPFPAPGTRSVYLKAMDRKVWAFALVSVAAVLHREGQNIRGARLVLGGVAPIPWRVPAAEQVLVGQNASEEVFRRAAEVALADARPLEYNGYKVPLAHSLIVQALHAAMTQPD